MVKDDIILIAAPGANYDTSKVLDATALVGLRIINLTVVTAKSSDEKPGTKVGPTIITYVHIGI